MSAAIINFWGRINLGLRLWAWGLLILIIGILAAFPIILSQLPYRVTLMFSVMIFIVLAESYDIVGGHMGYINLGHTSFFAIGAYAFGIALRNGMSVPLAFLLAALAALVFAGAISIPIFRLREVYFAIATFGMTILLNLLAFNLDKVPVVNPLTGNELDLGTGGSFGLLAPTGNVKRESYWAALLLVLITIAINVWVSRSKFGLALFSIREDEDVAGIFGIRVQLYKSLALMLSSITPGLAGAVFLWNFTYIEPFSVLGPEIVLIPVVMAMLGGSGITIGPLVGALFIMFVQQFVFVSLHLENFRLAIYGLILAGVGLFMPGGMVRQSWFVRISERIAHAARLPRKFEPHSFDGRSATSDPA